MKVCSLIVVLRVYKRMMPDIRYKSAFNLKVDGNNFRRRRAEELKAGGCFSEVNAGATGSSEPGKLEFDVPRQVSTS